MVAMLTCTNPFGALSSSGSMTARTAASSASIENTASPLNASRAVETGVAPSFASSSTDARERFHTRTLWPAFRRLAATRDPIVPRPMNPTSIVHLPWCECWRPMRGSAPQGIAHDIAEYLHDALRISLYKIKVGFLDAK